MTAAGDAAAVERLVDSIRMQKWFDQQCDEYGGNHRVDCEFASIRVGDRFAGTPRSLTGVLRLVLPLRPPELYESSLERRKPRLAGSAGILVDTLIRDVGTHELHDDYEISRTSPPCHECVRKRPICTHAHTVTCEYDADACTVLAVVREFADSYRVSFRLRYDSDLKCLEKMLRGHRAFNFQLEKRVAALQQALRFESTVYTATQSRYQNAQSEIAGLRESLANLAQSGIERMEERLRDMANRAEIERTKVISELEARRDILLLEIEKFLRSDSAICRMLRSLERLNQQEDGRRAHRVI
ncbi:hypothetical protein EAI_07773 [Harpegnathos saltator]|uniref:Uncharacterized protein n=1 Tax=Harpegnathos saltator TaxID=610380 RepID=E2C344_HARSA|nr:hypothetical protein EAI_07773 [Harpegnathos saltator]